ncbi:GntR family transcriptional regulator [Xylophilus sp. GOD-11R]|uniref:GntR family transcriptional regulator n=1 Tax=Xylophilus sp. GOD-11R TaxID=3089814 RepID=UPI00298C71DC|nr:GntR family transcriptional regulator [Xylophilus sp. GOD-11R]WPB59221.1 GntR family transcriptional regulator [Xylophilus sp. GOD-11R]
MNPETDERGQRSLFAARRLRELIVSGRLVPGQRITERLIAEQLDGVSRTPLREAFKILEAEGLVTIEPNRGAVVTSMSVDEVSAAIEVLIGLESLAAEPACRQIEDEEIAAIEALHARMAQAYEAGELMEYFGCNQAIHQAIVDAARNPVLSRIYATESARIRRYRYAGNRRTERWQRAVFEHEAILDAVRQRAGPLLREILRQHHASGWKVARDYLKTELQPPPSPARAPVRKTARAA